MLQIDGRTALIAASVNGHVEAIRALLDAGAAVNQTDVSGDGGAGCVCVCEVRVWRWWSWLRGEMVAVTVHAMNDVCGLCVRCVARDGTV